MKKYPLYISFCILIWSSCNKSFLEKYPVGQISKEQLLQDAEGLRTALNGAYNLTAQYYLNEFGMLGDIRGDDIVMRPTGDLVMAQEYNYQVEPENPTNSTSYIWQKLYEALNNTNNVINAAPIVYENRIAERNSVDSLHGQARVLRALIHFNLSQAFAQPYNYSAGGQHLGMPILHKTPDPKEHIKRESMADLYEFIIADLEKGIELMTGNNNLNRVTASIQGAQAFLSRIYLYMENWEECIRYADLVENSGRFKLEDREHYLQMFVDPGQVAGNRSAEVIWQLNLTPSNSGTMNKMFSDPTVYRVSPSQKLLALFEPGDVRGTLFGEGDATDQLFTLKYGRTADTDPVNWPANYKLFRLAEIYLNRAESKWHLGDYEGAVEELQKLRARAFGIPVQDVAIAYSSPADLLLQIKDERRRELAFEGHRIYDIMRYKEDLVRGSDCNAALCQLSYPNDLFVLPIPQLELDANPLMQPNPGVNN